MRLGVGDARCLNRSRGVKKRSRTTPNLVLNLTLLPARSRSAGHRFDEVVAAHLQEAAIAETGNSKFHPKSAGVTAPLDRAFSLDLRFAARSPKEML